jgi:ankyrin repeat protein
VLLSTYSRKTFLPFQAQAETPKHSITNMEKSTLTKTDYVKMCLTIAGILLIHTNLWAGPLHDAAEMGSIKRIEQLVQQGEDVNEIDERGIWPLLAACTNGDSRTVVLLLKLGADPNLADQYNYTALHEVSTLGYREVAEILIKARADIDTRDISGFTPLGYARYYGHQEVIELLEHYGATNSDNLPGANTNE